MIKKHKILFFGVIAVICLFFFSGCATTAGTTSTKPSMQGSKKTIPVHEIIFPAPKDKEALTYLGLSGEESFNIPQIKADVVLINVFSTTCPHCKKEAPNTNKLFQTIEDRPDFKGRIKIIGIGTRNSLEDVAKIKEEYKVPFPLFSDKDMSIFTQLAATGTPTMIGVKLLEDGTHSIFFRKAGSIGDVSWFIDFLLDMARLEK